MNTDTTQSKLLQSFREPLAPVSSLVPVAGKGRRVLPPHYLQVTVTIVGLKTTTGRFLPVSHEGDSNETYVDKVELLGKTRAEFIGRKLKGIERRMHMRLFRQLTEAQPNHRPWKEVFRNWFSDRICEIPDGLCTLCWNDSLFGSLETENVKGATFSRVRYFDTYSIEDADECLAQLTSAEGMAIGNTVGEDLSKGRSDSSYHQYEYVKPGTHFPFITVVENPTLLDIAGLLHAITAADVHGYGKYSASSGKFQTDILAVSTGLPRFSVLDMLEWADGSIPAKEVGTERQEVHLDQDHKQHVVENAIGATAIGKLRSCFSSKNRDSFVRFEDGVRGQAETLWERESDMLRDNLAGEFSAYVAALGQGK